jgi:endonuclease YncB( thermonuclease family)
MRPHPAAFVTLVLAALLGPAGVASAAPRSFAGVVTSVSDGDTVRVRPASGGAPVVVRLEGIDAPEICQPHGPQAQAALASLLLRRPVTVHARRHDDYDRLLGRVQLQGDDAGAWMVERGHAWSYRHRGDAGPYAAEQSRARQGRRGLWASPHPVEPRSFRRQQGSCHVNGR